VALAETPATFALALADRVVVLSKTSRRIAQPFTVDVPRRESPVAAGGLAPATGAFATGITGFNSTRRLKPARTPRSSWSPVAASRSNRKRFPGLPNIGRRRLHAALSAPPKPRTRRHGNPPDLRNAQRFLPRGSSDNLFDDLAQDPLLTG